MYSIVTLVSDIGGSASTAALIEFAHRFARRAGRNLRLSLQEDHK